MGKDTQPTIEENISGSPTHHYEQSEAIAEKSPNFSGSLSEQHFQNNAQPMPDGVAADRNVQPIKDTVIASEIATRGNLMTMEGELNVSGSLNDNTNKQSLAERWETHSTAKENHFSGSLNDIDLPELNTENWHMIVQKLTPQLGANVLLAQHSSLVKVEDNQVTLSVHKSGELFCKPNHLSALGEILAQHYGTQKNIQLVEWQEHFESVTQTKTRHKHEQQQQQYQQIENDPFAQKLQQTFGGEWTIQ